MKPASFHGSVRKPSLNNSAGNDLRLDLSNVATVVAPQTTAEPDVKRHAPDSPRQPTMSLPSEAPVTESVGESASDLTVKDSAKLPGVGARARRGSATMRSFLQRVMRSQSDSHIRIAPMVVHPDGGAAVEHEAACNCARDKSTEAQAATEDRGKHDEEEEEEREDQIDDDGLTGELTTTTTVYESGLSEDQEAEVAGDDGLCDVFLNSSLQLLQVQSEAKQRVRQLWTCAQRLRWENQLSDAGIELLHQELLGVMKVLTVEKLDGPRHVKAGYLTLVQAPPAVIAANIMQRGAAAATKSLLFGAGAKPASLDQRVWVNLSEEQCRMELVPAARADERPPPQQQQQPAPSSSNDAVPQQTTAFGKFKLPNSISWLLSDPMQAQTKDEDTNWIGRTAIKLQGCQARRLPDAFVGPAGAPPRVRFQLLVPNSSDPTHISAAAPSSSTGASQASTAVVPDPASSTFSSSSSDYGVYVFEVPPLSADANAATERERDEWLRAIDRVCVFHLYALERQLREACYMLQFRDILAASFPVCVPLTWLRNRLEKATAAGQGSSGGAMSAQQLANFQYQQLQRRSSRNLSMVQIVKDLERDRILVDKKLLITCAGSSKGTGDLDGSMVVEHDSVGEIVKYLVGKAMVFARRGSANSTQATRAGRTMSLGKPPMAPSPPHAPSEVTSPSSRLSKFTEARALAFVERVLRGSSRTQSGGDIYDAISFFCQQRNLTICPMSHDAHPVQLNVVEDGGDAYDEESSSSGGGAFHIEIEVSMQFKVVEMPAMTPRFDECDAMSDALTAMASPREWAVLEGTLRRQFTLGKLSEPGSVTVKFIPDPECRELNDQANGNANT